MSAALDQEIVKEQEAINYRPILRKVRRLESQIRTYEKEIKSINKEIQIEKKMSNGEEVESFEFNGKSVSGHEKEKTTIEDLYQSVINES